MTERWHEEDHMYGNIYTSLFEMEQQRVIQNCFTLFIYGEL